MFINFINFSFDYVIGLAVGQITSDPNFELGSIDASSISWSGTNFCLSLKRSHLGTPARRRGHADIPAALLRLTGQWRRPVASHDSLDRHVP